MGGGIVAAAAEPTPAAVHSVNSVSDSERIAKLFSDLRAAGVDARPTPKGIELKGPTAGLTVELLDRLRADRDGLLAWLRRCDERRAIAEADGKLSPVDAERVASAEGLAPGPVPAVEDAPAVLPRPTAGRAACPWCGPVELLDDPEGLRCGRCERLAWACDGGSLIRADCMDDDLEGLDPDDVPTCPTCGRWCDTETVTGAWLCSRCGPDAEARRRRTLRVLDRAERLRSRR